MSAKKLESLLNPKDNGDLHAVIRRAQDMGDLTAALQRALPADARHAIVAVNLRNDDELIVIASTPAWASRLRFESESLLEAAIRAGTSATTCRVRVSQLQSQEAVEKARTRK